VTTRAAHVFTDRRHGDLAVDGAPVELAARRDAVRATPWTWLRQVHGSRVVQVTVAGEHAGVQADAAVTATPGVALAVHSADCASVLLVGEGGIGVAHAGWRGIVAGVIESTAAAMADLGTPPQRAVLGPCIRSRCYEFGDDDLDAVAARYGDGVRSTTGWGTGSLDLAAAVTGACRAAGIDELDDAGTCTACSPLHWSHRVTGDTGRQALVAWLGP